MGCRDELKELLSFLDTLEAETSYDTLQYNPSPSVDIGDVARVQFASHAKVFDKKRKAVFDWEQFKEVAGIFYGFGQQNNTLSEEPVSDCHDLEEAAENSWVDYEYREDPRGLYSSCYIDGFKAGAEWQKAKMMEGAVEGEVVKDISNKLAATAKNINLDGLKFGDKVKIIIVKEDGQ